MQVGAENTNSSRHRIRNNLPGKPDFCPLVFRTAELQAFCNMDLAAKAREAVDAVPRGLLARTAAFLLLMILDQATPFRASAHAMIAFIAGAAP